MRRSLVLLAIAVAVAAACKPTARARSFTTPTGVPIEGIRFDTAHGATGRVASGRIRVDPADTDYADTTFDTPHTIGRIISIDSAVIDTIGLGRGDTVYWAIQRSDSGLRSVFQSRRTGGVHLLLCRTEASSGGVRTATIGTGTNVNATSAKICPCYDSKCCVVEFQ